VALVIMAMSKVLPAPAAFLVLHSVTVRPQRLSLPTVSAIVGTSKPTGLPETRVHLH
jgi:hypothetical protein